VKNAIVFSTRESAYLADEIANSLGADRGSYTVNTFADGEDEHIIDPSSLQNLRKQDAVLVGSTHDANNYLELTDLLALLRGENARRVMAVIPYLGWSTQERRNTPGQSTKAYNRVRGIYRHHPDETVFVDLHNAEVMQAHDGRRSVEMVTAEPLFDAYIRENFSLSDIIMVAPDVGRGKTVQRAARRLDVAHAVLSKERYGLDSVRGQEVVMSLRGKTVVLIDDMIRTGGTNANAARQCLLADAGRVISLATHAVLPRSKDSQKDGERRLADSPIEQVIVTNTHPRSQSITSKKFSVLSMGEMIADHLKTFLLRQGGNGFNGSH
jgi:ribose-phosphate pyrophosphokinase